MAFTIQTSTPSVFDTAIDQSSDLASLKLGFDGDADQAAQVTRDGCDFLIVGRSTAAEAATTVLDLTAAGVTFPAGFMRWVDVECTITGAAANAQGGIRTSGIVQGGATPVIPAAATVLVSSLGAGITAATCAVLMNGSSVNVRMSGGTAATILNWLVRVKVGKARPALLGI
jgi:hypothetical protein